MGKKTTQLSIHELTARLMGRDPVLLKMQLRRKIDIYEDGRPQPFVPVAIRYCEIATALRSMRQLGVLGWMAGQGELDGEEI